MKLAYRTLALSAILVASAVSGLGATFFESFETGLSGSPGATASGQTLTLASGDWYAVNHSGAIGTITGVFAGSATTLPAYDGTSYAGFNYNSASGANTISVWLITPELSFTAGDIVSFYTRTVDSPTYPDRLVVRASDNGASLNIGAGANDVGDFDMVLGTVNPTLSTSGYPNVYTLFSYAVPFTGTGRIAFNYHVTNGGPSGSNSDYIGLDAVSISGPAIVPEPSSFAALAGLAGLGLAVARRRRASA
jgi:hypothetical protein